MLNKLILSVNKLFMRGGYVHPLTLEKESPGSYAKWEYDIAKKTFAYFPENFLKPENFKGKKILDLCCGAGGKSILLSELGAAEVVGIDIDEQFIDMANKHVKSKGFANCRFEVGDARNLKYADDTFDYVFSFDALEHVSPPDEMVASAKRVLKPSGKLIMSFTNWERHDGHHMTDAIRFPWVHLLVSEKRLLSIYRGLVNDQMYLLRAGSLDSTKIGYVNKLRLKQARKIINSSGMKKIHYKEITYGGMLGIIAKIPGLSKYFTRVITTILEDTK